MEGHILHIKIRLKPIGFIDSQYRLQNGRGILEPLGAVVTRFHIPVEGASQPLLEYSLSIS